MMSKSVVRRLVHVSSFVAYDWSKAIFDERTPLLTDMYSMDGYTIARVWQERVVSRAAAAHSWNLTILRPGFIWGRAHAAIGGMGRIFGRVYLMFGPCTRLPLTHIVNCAHCVVAALECPAAVGEEFNVIDGDQVRVLHYVREHARQTGRHGILLPVPYRLGLAIVQLASFISRMLFGKKRQLPSILMPRRYERQFKPIRFSNKKLKDKLGWSAPLTFEECINLTF